MPHALLVDDDSDAAETMAMLIANEGFTVATAGLAARRAPPDGAAGARHRPARPACCPTAAAWSCSTTPSSCANAEVVLITGHASLETSIQALRLGAADYLVKPIEPEAAAGRAVARDRAVGAEGRGRRPATTSCESRATSAQLWGRSAPMRRVYEQIVARRRHRGHGVHHRRERHRQGARRADRARPEPAPQPARSSPSTAARSRRT